MAVDPEDKNPLAKGLDLTTVEGQQAYGARASAQNSSGEDREIDPKTGKIDGEYAPHWKASAGASAASSEPAAGKRSLADIIADAQSKK